MDSTTVHVEGSDARNHSDLQIYQNPPAGSLWGLFRFRLCAASQHLDGITTWLSQLVLAHFAVTDSQSQSTPSAKFQDRAGCLHPLPARARALGLPLRGAASVSLPLTTDLSESNGGFSLGGFSSLCCFAALGRDHHLALPAGASAFAVTVL